MKLARLLSVLFIGVYGIVVVGCKDDGPGNGNGQGGSSAPPQEERQKLVGNVAFLSQITSGTELGEAIIGVCANVSQLENAQIAFVTGGDLESLPKGELLDFYNKGGLITVVNPDANTDDFLIEELKGGYSPITDNIGALLFAFNNRDQFFIILKNGVECVPNQEVVPVDEEVLNGLIGKTDEDESKINDEEIKSESEITAHEHDDYYYYMKLEDFIEWVNENYDDRGLKLNAKFATRVANSYNPSVDISRNYFEISYTMPVSLHNKIDQATWSDPDRLDYDTNITYNAQIYPVYLHSLETENSAAGDYYIVEGTITAHNGDIWHPKQCSHGGTNNRVVGYFMKDLRYKVELVGDDGKPLGKLNFYRDPIPTTTVQSTSYSSGFSADFNMALSGKAAKGSSPEIGLDAGFNLSWSSSVEQTLDDVLTQRFTDMNKGVEYLYTVCNINSDRNWGDWNRKYPLLSRSDFSAPSAWIWKVPNNTNGVGENSTKSFSLKLTISATYGSYNWWRGASWDSTKEFSVGPETKTIPIAAPSRESFGVIALQNAGTLTVGNMVVYNMDNQQVNIQGSINKSQTAKKKLKAGTYYIEYDLIDPDADNKLVSRWKISDVEVKMGNDEESSTTTVSTVNAQKIKQY